MQLLKQICDQHQHRLEQGDWIAAGDLDFQFRRELTRAADNELLLSMLDSISEVLREIRYQSMAAPHVGAKGLQAHRRILRGVIARNPQPRVEQWRTTWLRRNVCGKASRLGEREDA